MRMIKGHDLLVADLHWQLKLKQIEQLNRQLFQFVSFQTS